MHTQTNYIYWQDHSEKATKRYPWGYEKLTKKQIEFSLINVLTTTEATARHWKGGEEQMQNPFIDMNDKFTETHVLYSNYIYRQEEETTFISKYM